MLDNLIAIIWFPFKTLTFTFLRHPVCENLIFYICRCTLSLHLLLLCTCGDLGFEYLLQKLHSLLWDLMVDISCRVLKMSNRSYAKITSWPNVGAESWWKRNFSKQVINFNLTDLDLKWIVNKWLIHWSMKKVKWYFSEPVVHNRKSFAWPFYNFGLWFFIFLEEICA